MDYVMKTVREALSRSVCAETERVHNSLSVKDKQTAFLHKKQYIESKGDKLKRRKAREESERWVSYLADVGKIDSGDRALLLSWLCPMG